MFANILQKISAYGQRDSTSLFVRGRSRHGGTPCAVEISPSRGMPRSRAGRGHDHAQHARTPSRGRIRNGVGRAIVRVGARDPPSEAGEDEDQELRGEIEGEDAPRTSNGRGGVGDAAAHVSPAGRSLAAREAAWADPGSRFE